MPKTNSSKPVVAKADTDDKRFNPLYIPDRLKRWRQAAKELHKTSCKNYKEIKAYITEVEMTDAQKKDIANALSEF